MYEHICIFNKITWKNDFSDEKARTTNFGRTNKNFLFDLESMK